jgi:uncharacterized radical SAM superfamily protein
MLEILKILAMDFQRIIKSVKRKVIQIRWKLIGLTLGSISEAIKILMTMEKRTIFILNVISTGGTETFIAS